MSLFSGLTLSGRLDNKNDVNANILKLKDKPDANLQMIYSLLCQGDTIEYLQNFLLSGSYVQENYEVLKHYISFAMGKCPILVFHHKTPIRDKIIAWHSEQNTFFPLFCNDAKTAVFEPFLSMRSEQIVNVLYRIAKRMEFQVTSHYNTIVRAHLKILELAGEQVCLSGLYKLCKIESIRDFYAYVRSLKSPVIAEQVLSSMGLDKEGHMEQYQLFRNVILSMAYELEQSGWSSDANAERVNCLTIKKYESQPAPILLCSIEDTCSRVFFTYLAEEMKGMSDHDFVLILDNIRFDDEDFLQYLMHPGTNCRYGIIGENLPAMVVVKQENAFAQLAEHIDIFLLLKHRTAEATKPFSELIGNFDAMLLHTTRGNSQDNTAIIKRNLQESNQVIVQNRYRIMPEYLINLDYRTVCVFDTGTNEIHFMTLKPK